MEHPFQQVNSQTDNPAIQQTDVGFEGIEPKKSILISVNRMELIKDKVVINHIESFGKINKGCTSELAPIKGREHIICELQNSCGSGEI